MNFLLYEEYFPYTEELKKLSTQYQAVFETYRMLMCHYHISRCP